MQPCSHFEVCGCGELADASYLKRKLKVTDGTDVILEAENKYFPPIEKHCRKEASLLHSSMMVTVESKSPLKA